MHAGHGPGAVGEAVAQVDPQGEVPGRHVQTQALIVKGKVTLLDADPSAIVPAMYYLAIRQFARSLKNLDAVLEKAIKYAEARKFDVNNFLTARLFPDMLPFVTQVRIACDNAKSAAALLSGKEAPKHEDNETTVAELRGRIAKCLAYLDTFTASDFEKTNAQTLVKLPNRPGKGMYAEEYLFGRQLPNFYFHLTTAYDLLRHGGVELGKSDYLGQLNIVEV
jgi:hypothetical protein